jgi:hypothetical protein
VQRRAKLGRPTQYDWDDLIKESMLFGKEHEFTAGEDFDCMPRSFASLVRRTARVRGLRVEVSVAGETVYFQFKKNS